MLTYADSRWTRRSQRPLGMTARTRSSVQTRRQQRQACLKPSPQITRRQRKAIVRSFCLLYWYKSTLSALRSHGNSARQSLVPAISLSAESRSRFTCFTGTKVQVLALKSENLVVPLGTTSGLGLGFRDAESCGHAQELTTN
jgi:hypothetical protein